MRGGCSGLNTINSQRFGQKFVCGQGGQRGGERGGVCWRGGGGRHGTSSCGPRQQPRTARATQAPPPCPLPPPPPQDILLWAKAAARKAKPEGGAAGAGELLDARAALRPEQLDQEKIEDLISRHLQHDLQVLPPAALGEALHKWVLGLDFGGRGGGSTSVRLPTFCTP